MFDVDGGKDAEGQYVKLETKNGKVNQKWTVVYSDQVDVQTKGVNKEFGFEINRPFFIVSKLWMSRVITVTGGSNLVIKSREGKGQNTQHWFFDQSSKTIKSVAYKGKSFDIQSSGGSANMQIYATNARWF